MAVAGAHGHGDVVAHHLAADHGQGLGLGRVDLARHDRAAGLVLRQLELAEAAARAGAQSRMSLAIFIRLAASTLSAPCSSTMASWLASASNLLGAVTNGRPVIAATSAANASAKPFLALRPVPTAVPPWASW